MEMNSLWECNCCAFIVYCGFTKFHYFNKVLLYFIISKNPSFLLVVSFHVRLLFHN